MDFKDQLKQLSDRIIKIKDQVATEEATKNAFIMPLIQILGYDIFNPTEVVPEFVADIGTKKGEKIDYAITRDGKPLILIECKHWARNLNVHEGQLIRYFQAANARFGILTNGINYRFYSDLDKPNIMDEKPFFEIDLLNIKENEIEELKKFHKSYFDLDSIVNTASELKYTSEIKTIIQNEITTPSEWFVRGIARIVYPSVVTAKVVEQFTALTKKSFSQVISDTITDRLKNALQQETNAKESDPEQHEIGTTKEPENIPVTTEEELEGFYTVRAALRSVVPMNRIVCRDSLSFFAILLDDNNRKPICRLYFNNPKKVISVFDENKKEIKYEITSIDDIFKYTDFMVASIQRYDNMVKSVKSENVTTEESTVSELSITSQ